MAPKDTPEGFLVSGGRVPAGQDSARMTLTAPRKAPPEPVRLHLEGRARIGDDIVTHAVVPCEDVMQAFLYRHLLPSQELLVAVTRGGRFAPAAAPLEEETFRIPAGGSARVSFKAPQRSVPDPLILELSDPPEGMTLRDVTRLPDGFSLQLTIEADTLQIGDAGNAIVEIFTERTIQPKGEDGEKKPPRTRRVSLGYLPAVRFVVVRP